MSHARVLGIVGLTALAAAAVAIAQTTVTPIPENAPVQTAPLDAAAAETVTWGDPQKGQTLAGTCAACHGLDGNPPDPMYPRIAGQSERYIAEQIARFKHNQRTSGMAAIMKPFADMLSAQDARDVGAYYATQRSGAGVADDTLVTSGPHEGKRFYEIGEELFLAGDRERGIPACMACHGPDGAGNPGPAYPRVAGQLTDYTQRRLQEYRSGTSTESGAKLFQVMADVAAELTDEEVGAVSSYLAGLHPAADDLAAIGAPAAAAPVAVATAGPATASEAEAGAADAGAEPVTDGAETPADAGDEATEATEAATGETEQG